MAEKKYYDEPEWFAEPKRNVKLPVFRSLAELIPMMPEHLPPMPELCAMVKELIPKERPEFFETHLQKLLSEIHAAGYLWALITLKDIFPEPLHTIALKAEDACSIRPEEVLLYALPPDIYVRPDPEFEALPVREWGPARRTAAQVLSVLNALLLDNDYKEYLMKKRQDTPGPEGARNFGNQEEESYPTPPYVVRY